MARAALQQRDAIIGRAFQGPLAGGGSGAILCGFADHDRVTSMATSSKAKKKTVRLASGRKRARQDVKLNAANSSLRSKFRTAIKNVQKAVLSGDKVKATELYKSGQSVIDSIADKGLFHKNKAARHKSRLSAKLKALAA
jgi:small subunit ribosomal protein S20